MTEPAAFEVRLKEGLVRIGAHPASGDEAATLPALRRSVEHTLLRLAGSAPEAAAFRFQVNGGKGVLFQGALALPLEPARLARLLTTMDLALGSGESLDIDGELASWVIQPEVTLTDTQLRHAEESLRTMRIVPHRERDHSAFQVADSMKIRLRSRLNQLVGALQAAQRGPDKPA